VDFSVAGWRAVQSAVSLGTHFGADLTFFHVLEPVSDDPEIVLHWADFPQERRNFAEKELSKLCAQVGRPEAARVVVEGRAFEEILRCLAQGEHQVVVMGLARREKGFIKGLLGTTVERVARHSPVPMLVVREDHETLEQHPQRLALATDFSKASLEAFPWAEAISRAYGASIELVNVQEPMGLPGTLEYERHQQQIDALRETAEETLREFREQHLAVDLDVTATVREGTPSRALCRLARDREVDLLLLATRGAKGWRRVWLGGTTEEVLRHAPCPVVIIPPGVVLGEAEGESELDSDSESVENVVAESRAARLIAPSRKEEVPLLDLAAPVSSIMGADFPMLSNALTIRAALDDIRQHGVSDRLIYFYVTGPDQRLLGVIPTRRLLTAPLEDTVGSHMIQKVTVLRPDDTLLEASEVFSRHKYLALPVVDVGQRLVGVVDVGLMTEQIFDLAEREQMEEMFESIGFQANQVKEASPLRAFRFRFPWLVATITSGTLCALLTSLYEVTLAQSIVLAFFMTLILGLGESVSIQSMTVAIQALRSTKPTLKWYLKALRKEALTAVLLGLGCGSVVGVIVWLWRGEGMAAVSIALSITLALVTACVTGLSVPSALHAARLDPKIAAGPITLALTDICTLLFYFGLASWLLGKG
jgi:magnesium transporter